MVAGRPREHDYLKEAQDLEEWSLLEDSINLYAFVDRKPYLASELSEFAKRCPEFAESLKKAKNRIALRRERMLCAGKLHIAAWGRSARLYDTLLKNQEDQDKDDEVERQKKVNKDATNAGEQLIKILIDKATDKSRDIVKDQQDA
jgi:hypothetical protein